MAALCGRQEQSGRDVVTTETQDVVKRSEFLQVVTATINVFQDVRLYYPEDRGRTCSQTSACF
jgi:hypothetical protein